MHPKAGPALARRLESAQDYDVFEVNIFLREEPAKEVISSLEGAADSEGRESRINVIRRATEVSQRPLLEFLEGAQRESLRVDEAVSIPQASNVESFWINNAIKANLTLSSLRQVLDRPDVSLVELARYADMQELLDSPTRVIDRPVGRKRVKAKPVRELSAASAEAPAPETWSVRRVNAPLLWQRGIDGTGVLVAVVDSGVNYKHPDLRAQMWQSGQYPHHGYDFASNDDDPVDNEGHGTCCAGIVAGNGAAGKATGIAPRATIMAIRVGGTEAQFWRGMQFAIEQGANVITMSMTWKFPSNPNYPGWRRTCETILAAGILHANSIGNQGDQPGPYPIPYNIATPGNCPPPRLHALQEIRGGISSAISCGATSDSDELARYSGRGPAAWERGDYLDYPYANGSKSGLVKPDLCAPGPGTKSCNFAYDGDSSAGRPYVSFGGTSSATPHVAGCLALLACACLRSRKPIVPALVQEALENTAVRIVGQSRDKENHYGAGRVDVYAAYLYGLAKGWWTADVV